MSLCECIYCGKQISIYAKKCPHCGLRVERPLDSCQECGSVISSTAKHCPICGCPTSSIYELQTLQDSALWSLKKYYDSEIKSKAKSVESLKADADNPYLEKFLMRYEKELEGLKERRAKLDELNGQSD